MLVEIDLIEDYLMSLKTGRIGTPTLSASLQVIFPSLIIVVSMMMIVHLLATSLGLQKWRSMALTISGIRRRLVLMIIRR
jgi:hypothetical protein